MFDIKGLLSLILIGMFFSACTHKTTLEPDSEEIVYFDTQILPLFQNSCATSGCHNAQSREEGYNLSNYDSIVSKGVIKGDAINSSVYKAIIGKTKLMPPQNPLPEAQRNLIRLWIDQGADNTKEPTPPDVIVAPDTTGPLISFPQKIHPLLLSNCGTSGCHDAATKQSGYDFTSYESIISNGIEPNDAQASKIYRVIIASETEVNFMPPAPMKRLSEEEKYFIEKWINRGVLNEDTTEVCQPESFDYLADIAPTIQTYCEGCHQSGAASGGIVLETEQQLTFFAQNGQLENALGGLNGAVKMPPIISISSCKATQISNWIASVAIPPPVEGAEFCFTRDVQPILVSNCASSGCHDAATHEEGYNFTTYASTIKKGVVSGNAAGSKIYKVITTSQNEDDFMPPAPRSPLTNDQIAAIARWINEGIKDEVCTESCDPLAIDFKTNIAPIIKRYCQGCHQSGAANGNVVLESESQIVAIAKDGRLVNTLNATNGFPLMPPSMALSDCEIEEITNWVNSLN